MQYDENAEKYGYEGEMTPMKCDELKVYVAPTPDGTGLADYCLKSEVDAAIAELKEAWRSEHEACEALKAELDKAIAERDGNQVCIDALKQKLEDAKATAYAESVDAGMRERRLRRALYNACANWASSESCFWDGYAADLAEHKPAKSDILTAKSRRFEMMEIKCLKKVEEYR